MKSKVEFLKKLPSKERLTEALGFKPEKYVIICDRQIAKLPEAKKWLSEFACVYPVKGGEDLKNLSEFGDHVKKIAKLVSPFSTRGLCVVGVGGGTVGDFTGFLASTVRRGVPLIHIPTTLLSAMDSAHGGKTALNVGEFKNQIGTFYPADCILIVRSLFEGLPDVQLQSASGELAKMALIDGGELFEQLKSNFKLELDFLWGQLPKAIEIKHRWVQKDPLEQSGERQILNLGHSLGHVLESYFGLPHGVAVGEGLIFALRWSHHQGFLSAAAESEGLQVLQQNIGFLGAQEFAKRNRQLSRSRLVRLISEDKKLTDARHMNFVFLENIGAPFRKKMALESFLTETQRQGWASL